MRKWVLALLVLGTAGCEVEQVENAVRKIGAELAEMTLKEVGELASRVAENPQVADSILSANGIDMAQLDSIMSELGEEAEVIGGALAELSVQEVGELASRITEDRSVADSLLSAHGVEVGQLDEVLDRIGSDAEALEAYLESLGQSRER